MGGKLAAALICAVVAWLVIGVVITSCLAIFDPVQEGDYIRPLLVGPCVAAELRRGSIWYHDTRLNKSFQATLYSKCSP